jgi:CBS domain-containing protein
MRMTVHDVMTGEVVTVRGDTSFHDLVRLLAKHHVSALPVVDVAGRAVGMVSESDLFLKQVEPIGDGVGRLLQGRRRRLERAKSAGATARQVMTAPAVTVHREQPIADAARLMHDRGVRRLAVVNNAGVVVGIVTRGDLLKAYLRADREIAEELTIRALPEVLERPSEAVRVEVTDGVVRLTGRVTRRRQVLDLERRARVVDGVVAVDSLITYEVDDTSDWATRAPLPTL